MRKTTVIAADNREWEVRRTVEWSTPALGDEFEHDVDGGRPGPLLAVTGLVLFWVVLVVWMPDDVHVPWWLVVFGVIGVGFFPVRWFVRRPVTIVAETRGGYDLPPEFWIGMVRGRRAAREEAAVAVRLLRTRATPGHADSRLQPVN